MYFYGIIFCLIFHISLGFTRETEIIGIKVYDRINLQGDSREFTGYQRDLRSEGFDNKVCSASMDGIWILYEHLDFNTKDGMSYFAWGNSYDVLNFGKMKYHTSSLRSAGIGNFLQRSTLNFYEKEGFGGREQYYSGDIPFLMEEMNFHSLILTGCEPWTLYDDKFFDGDRICVFPGDEDRCYPGFFPRHEDFGYFGSRVQSARIGCFSEVKARVSNILPNNLFSFDANSTDVLRQL
uniref:Crystallin, beta A1 [Equus caballus] n=1 Tax=Lepeophtheirus salmonis TaxID=72036 RepID=D3PHC6_LEPSM|nr:Gamma-crystallin-1 [Lepeophtheirus salmonis]